MSPLGKRTILSWTLVAIVVCQLAAAASCDRGDPLPAARAGDGALPGHDVGGPHSARGDDWWDMNWTYRMTLTFNNSDQSETLLDFPVLVNLTSSNFNHQNAKADGTDLRFIDADGSAELAYHIEEWDVNGESIVWVNVAGIDAASDTDMIYMYYGNPEAPSVVDEAGTYDQDFAGVWHLGETSGAHADSTANSNDGAVQGAVVQGAEGMMDGAVAFNGGDENISVAHDDSLDIQDDITLEAWMDGDGVDDWDSYGGINSTIIDTLEYDVDNAGNPEILWISGDVYALVHKGLDNDGYLRTVEIADDGAITDALIDTLEFDTAGCDKPKMVRVHGDIYAIAYKGFDKDGHLVTVEIGTDGAITDTIVDSFEFDTEEGDQADILNVAGNVFSIAYKNFTKSGVIKTVWIDNDGTINNTVMDTFRYDSSEAHNPDLQWISGDVYGIVSKDVDGDGQLVTVEIDGTGAITDTIIDSLEFDPQGGDKAKITHVSGNVYAIVYKDVDRDGQLVTVEIAQDGAITDTLIDQFEFDTIGADNSDMVHIVQDCFAISYKDDLGRGRVFTLHIGEDGSINTTKIDELVFDAAAGNEGELIHVAGNTYAVAYKGPDNDGFLKTIGIITDPPRFNSGVFRRDTFMIHSDSDKTYASINEKIVSGPTSSGWKYVVMTYDRDRGSHQISLYVDGSLLYTGTSTDPIDTNTGELLIGKGFSGRVDEVRVSATARSPEWIAAQHLSMSDIFITYGTEQPVTAVVPPALDRIIVEPGSADVPALAQQTFTARGVDQFGDEFSLTATAWDTDAGDITAADATTAVLLAGRQPFSGGWIRASQGMVSGLAVVNVTRTYGAPDIAGNIPDQKVREDSEPWVLNLSGYAHDAQDDLAGLRWYAEDLDESLVTIDGQNTWGNHELTFTPVPDACGMDEFNLLLEDSDGDLDSQEIRVTITPVNDAPEITGLPSGFECPEDDDEAVIDLSPYEYDVDNPPSELEWDVWGWDSTILRTVGISGDALSIVLVPDAWGEGRMTLELSDGSLRDTASIWVNVTPVNDPPVLQPIPPQSGYEDESWSLDLRYYCHDVDDTFSSLHFETNTTEVRVEGADLVFTGGKSSPPSVLLTVSDGRLNASVDFFLRILSEDEVVINDGTDPADRDEPVGPIPQTTDGDPVTAPGSPEYYYVHVAETIKDYTFAIVGLILYIFFVILLFMYTAVYKVEEVFLVHRTKGTVIHHLSHEEGDALDKEVVGSMLMVFQSFIKDAFSSISLDNEKNKNTSQEPDLTQFNIGRDKKVMIELGEHLYLAVIYKGSRTWLRKRLTRLVTRLEKRYGNKLQDWDGSYEGLEGSRELLEGLLGRSIARDLGIRSMMSRSGTGARAKDIPSGSGGAVKAVVARGAPRPMAPGAKPKLPGPAKTADHQSPGSSMKGTSVGSLLSRLVDMDKAAAGNVGTVGGADAPRAERAALTAGAAPKTAKRAVPAKPSPPKALVADGELAGGEGPLALPPVSNRPGVRRLEPVRADEELKDR